MTKQTTRPKKREAENLYRAGLKALRAFNRPAPEGVDDVEHEAELIGSAQMAFKTAAEKGYVPALFKLAEMCEKGLTLNTKGPDLKGAFEYYKSVLIEGYENSQYVDRAALAIDRLHRDLVNQLSGDFKKQFQNNATTTNAIEREKLYDLMIEMARFTSDYSLVRIGQKNTIERLIKHQGEAHKVILD